MGFSLADDAWGRPILWYNDGYVCYINEVLMPYGKMDVN
ncbi:hypothetical protein DFP97_113116 [Paenibacillus prosopidis]|uniref:Uncharacterized protein n=1 Tax=Paenibacillus prosopidis TaxID=630520 RepID=A0A368VPL5_9BACL|nr:hypothetical protein DFP97_113116 [Paenibacillus prosopidis]